MKKLLLLSFLSLGGCSPWFNVFTTAVVVADAGTVAVIQRTPGDAVYSWLTGLDCSAVRLDQGKTYCRPLEPPPEPPSYCTHSLGSVNCWKDPASVPGHPKGVADGPSTLTPEQEADRVRGWPW